MGPASALAQPGNNLCESKGDKSKAIPSGDIGDQTSGLTDILKTDFQNIRALVSCTICDQLLYEPFTLACGHTYCYSCLCSWFLPNKRKKTCPECRSAVKLVPAPAFLIKQMVEIFVNRAELLPSDESVEQHRQKAKEENDILEADKANDISLFKGCFSNVHRGHIRYDEADRVHVCNNCGHEYEGGPACISCGIDFEGEEEEIGDFSDAESLDSIEMWDGELDGELATDDDEEDDDDVDENDHWGLPMPWADQPLATLNGLEHLPAHIRQHLRASLGLDSQHRVIDLMSDGSENGGATQSDLDFIANDDEIQYMGQANTRSGDTASGASHDSDSEETSEESDDSENSDEGGAVSKRRRHRHLRAPESVAGTTPSVMTENSDQGGWSPLDNGSESEDGDIEEHRGNDSQDSDTETMVGNQLSDDGNEAHYRENGSITPQYRPFSFAHERGSQRSERIRGESIASTATDEYSSTDGYGEIGDDDSDGEGESVVDRDGDVEMSVSPIASRRSSYTSTGTEVLGPGRVIVNLEDDSSDGSIRPPVRRRRRGDVQRPSNSGSQRYAPSPGYQSSSYGRRFTPIPYSNPFSSLQPLSSRFEGNERIEREPTVFPSEQPSVGRPRNSDRPAIWASITARVQGLQRLDRLREESQRIN